MLGKRAVQEALAQRRDVARASGNPVHNPLSLPSKLALSRTTAAHHIDASQWPKKASQPTAAVCLLSTRTTHPDRNAASRLRFFLPFPGLGARAYPPPPLVFLILAAPDYLPSPLGSVPVPCARLPLDGLVGRGRRRWPKEGVGAGCVPMWCCLPQG